MSTLTQSMLTTTVWGFVEMHSGKPQKPQRYPGKWGPQKSQIYTRLVNAAVPEGGRVE